MQSGELLDMTTYPGPKILFIEAEPKIPKPCLQTGSHLQYICSDGNRGTEENPSKELAFSGLICEWH